MNAKSSTRATQRYIDKTYTQKTKKVTKEMAAQIKKKYKKEGIPQAKIIKKAIEDFLET